MLAKIKAIIFNSTIKHKKPEIEQSMTSKVKSVTRTELVKMIERRESFKVDPSKELYSFLFCLETGRFSNCRNIISQHYFSDTAVEYNGKRDFMSDTRFFSESVLPAIIVID